MIADYLLDLFQIYELPLATLLASVSVGVAVFLVPLSQKDDQ